MAQDASKNPYRIMVPTPSLQRRVIGTGLGVLIAIGFGLVSYWLAGSATPLWVLAVSFAIGSGLGLSVIAFGTQGRWRFAPAFLGGVVPNVSRHALAHFAGQPDNFTFFLMHLFALAAGFSLGVLTVVQNKPSPLTP